MTEPTPDIRDHIIVDTTDEIDLNHRLAAALRTSLYDRGNYVQEWPADEAAAYRDNGGFAEGRAAADRIRFLKASEAVFDFLRSLELEVATGS